MLLLTIVFHHITGMGVPPCPSYWRKTWSFDRAITRNSAFTTPQSMTTWFTHSRLDPVPRGNLTHSNPWYAMCRVEVLHQVFYFLGHLMRGQVAEVIPPNAQDYQNGFELKWTRVDDLSNRISCCTVPPRRPKYLTKHRGGKLTLGPCISSLLTKLSYIMRISGVI